MKVIGTLTTWGLIGHTTAGQNSGSSNSSSGSSGGGKYMGWTLVGELCGFLSYFGLIGCRLLALVFSFSKEQLFTCLFIVVYYACIYICICNIYILNKYILYTLVSRVGRLGRARLASAYIQTILICKYVCMHICMYMVSLCIYI